MNRIVNEQSLLLRRRLTVQTFIAFAVFTIVFAIFALVANNTLVPLISDAVVDATAEKIRFDPLDYASRYELDELVDSYVKELEKEGGSVEILWMTPSNDNQLDASISDESDGDEKDFALDGDASIASTDAEDQNEGSEKVKKKQDVNPYDVVIGEIQINSDKNSEEPEPSAYVEQLTLRKLGFYAAWKAYTQLDGYWDYWYEGSGSPEKYTSFIARNLTLYERIKTLKLPVVIALYMLGCLLIIVFQMRRSLRYFDELSSAVANIISDRSKPVALSPQLSIAQNELNRIRAESIADEYAAQAAEQRKNELVAYLAHDIRTPLTSILGYLSLLDESPDLPAESRQRFTHTALDKAERLESLINEFFEITRYNLQTIPIERSNVDIRLFLEQIADEFMPVASDKNVRIDIEAESLEGDSFYVDGGKLARAVENVLRNAVSYADNDTTVRIRVAPLRSHAQEDVDGKKGVSNDRWKISVINKGREISPEHLDSIFEKFYREDNARNASTGGAGLGLAIAKEIITAHGGSISATSENGQTSFDIIV